MNDLMAAINAENDALRALVERGRADLDAAHRDFIASEEAAQDRARAAQEFGCAQ